jgi:uncharacterized sulfatase
MDAQVGRVLDELDRLRLSANTIVVFLGDHGYSLGQHHAWLKMLLFDRVCRVPLIISVPGGKPAAAASLVESMDLYPTLVALAKLEPPAQLEGKSLEPILNDARARVHEAAFTQVQRGRRGEGRTVRTDRWRYTQWTAPREPATTAATTAGASTAATTALSGAGAELYDELADPEEFVNLADDPRYADTVADMKKLLAQRAKP